MINVIKILRAFHRLGDVSYEELRVSWRWRNFVPKTVTQLSFYLDKHGGACQFSLTITARYPLKVRAILFIKKLDMYLQGSQLQSRLVHLDKRKVRLVWKRDLSDLLQNTHNAGEADYARAIFAQLVSARAFAITIMQNLVVCSRVANRGGTRSYRQLTPSRLVDLATCNFRTEHRH